MWAVQRITWMVCSKLGLGVRVSLTSEHSRPDKRCFELGLGFGKCHKFAVNILKRFDDAIRDDDPIRAVIRGTATNSDGRAPGIASPDSKARAKATAIRATYLECHGTGTQAGDPTEVAAVSSVFAESMTPNNPLIIGSVSQSAC